MTTGFAEVGEFETNIQTNGEQQPTIEAVYQFQEAVLADKLARYIDTDEHGADERIRFVVETVRDLPEYTPHFLADLSSSQDPDMQILAAVIIPEALARGVATGALPNGSMDEIRDMWAHLMCSEEEDVSEEAQRRFRNETPELLIRDKVTFERIGWIATPNVVLLRPHRGYSEEIQARTRAAMQR
jgi:hypothetical protein